MSATLQTVASPPDISAILTSLGVFSLAIAAAVGGIYKGVKEVKKGGAPDSHRELAAGMILDGFSARALSESNIRLSEINSELRELIRHLCHANTALAESLKDHREIVRSQIEEQHRLRAGIVDLVDVIRRKL